MHSFSIILEIFQQKENPEKSLHDKLFHFRGKFKKLDLTYYY